MVWAWAVAVARAASRMTAMVVVRITAMVVARIAALDTAAAAGLVPAQTNAATQQIQRSCQLNGPANSQSGRASRFSVRIAAWFWWSRFAAMIVGKIVSTKPAGTAMKSAIIPIAPCMLRSFGPWALVP